MLLGQASLPKRGQSAEESLTSRNELLDFGTVFREEGARRGVNGGPSEDGHRGAATMLQDQGPGFDGEAEGVGIGVDIPTEGDSRFLCWP